MKLPGNMNSLSNNNVKRIISVGSVACLFLCGDTILVSLVLHVPKRWYFQPDFFHFRRRTHWDLHSSLFWKLFPGRGHPLILMHLFVLASYTHLRRNFSKQTAVTSSTGSRHFLSFGLLFDAPVKDKMENKLCGHRQLNVIIHIDFMSQQGRWGGVVSKALCT